MYVSIYIMYIYTNIYIYIYIYMHANLPSNVIVKTMSSLEET